MNKSTQSNSGRDRFEYFVKTLSDYRMLLIVPTIVCTVLALGYAVFKSNSWTARQSLVIRDDLVGESFKPGRFDSQDSLKSAQETILEIARKPQVIRNALKNLGPPPMTLTSRNNWPSEKVIEDVQGMVSIGAPNGAEFGKTEVILLSTKASSRERSRQFIELLLTEIDQKLREVRSAKIDSMSEELEQAVETARISFEQSAKRLQEMDARFGADLSTLRSLNLPNASDGSLQKTIIEIRAEQRHQTNEVDLAKKQQEMLIKSFQDPAQYLVTSSDLLKMQPRLDQLVTGLSKSQLELAKVSGKYTEEHTEVKSAKRAILDIKIQILKEIQASIHAVGANVEYGEDRIQKLVDRENKLEERLAELSSARVEYDKLEQEVGKKSEILGQARQDLVQVQSVGQSKIDLLTRVGEPQVSTRPDGPGKRSIVGAGMVGGLLIGLGLIMFTAPPFEDDDYSETDSNREHSQSPSPESTALDPTPVPPEPVYATPPEPNESFAVAPEEPVQSEPAQPAWAASAEYQSESEASDSEHTEAILKPRNVLEELHAQAQSELSARKDSQPEKQDSDSRFKERRVIPTRRKTETTPAADSAFVAAISKVSAGVDRNAPDSRSQPTSRAQSITDLFNPSLADEAESGESDAFVEPADLLDVDPIVATHPTAKMELVDDHSTFLKITNEPVPTTKDSNREQAQTTQVEIDREQAQTTQVEIGQLPAGLDLSQLSDPVQLSAIDQPITTEPLDEQKLSHKSNVRPIDLTKVIQGLSQRKPDPSSAAEFETVEEDPATDQPPNRRVSDSMIELTNPISSHTPADSLENDSSHDESIEKMQTLDTEIDYQSTPAEEHGSEDPPNVVKRQSAVTEQLLVKQIFTPLDHPDVAPDQGDSAPVEAETDAPETNSADTQQPPSSTNDGEYSAAASGRDEVLQWGDEISDSLSAAEIVQQLRARQQQAATDAATDAIKYVPQHPANHGEDAETNQPHPDSSLAEQANDSTDEATRPITGSSPINDQIKQLNDSIAEFCAPLKRKKKASEDEES